MRAGATNIDHDTGEAGEQGLKKASLSAVWVSIFRGLGAAGLGKVAIMTYKWQERYSTASFAGNLGGELLENLLV